MRCLSPSAALVSLRTVACSQHLLGACSQHLLIPPGSKSDSGHLRSGFLRRPALRGAPSLVAHAGRPASRGEKVRLFSFSLGACIRKMRKVTRTERFCSWTESSNPEGLARGKVCASCRSWASLTWVCSSGAQQPDAGTLQAVRLAHHLHEVSPGNMLPSSAVDGLTGGNSAFVDDIT